jgi:preprotein translocase SecE subunit
MTKYKPDQGVYARTTAMWLLGALWSSGAYTMYYWLLSFRGEGGDGLMVSDLADGNLPVLGTPLTPALIIAVSMGLAGLWVISRALSAPKAADMLIDSEIEMRKCTWPSWDETFNSSIVIVVVMLFFTLMLAGMDYFLNAFMTRVVF